MNYLAPSILAADFARLGEQIREADSAGAQYIHIDVMDGMFVPSISLGMPVISAVRPLTKRVFDVHLMIRQPEHYIDEFAACGADILTIHAEACVHLDRTLDAIRAKGMKAGLALCPSTPLSVLDYLWDKVDMVLLMTVNPGFGGQTFIESSFRKIARLAEMKKALNPSLTLALDGGVKLSNAAQIAAAGIDILDAGSAVLNAPDITEAVKSFKALI